VVYAITLILIMGLFNNSIMCMINNIIYMMVKSNYTRVITNLNGRGSRVSEAVPLKSCPPSTGA
jgi:hypothetical protein